MTGYARAPLALLPATPPVRSPGRIRSLAGLGLLLAIAFPAVASAAPRLRCRIDQGGETRRLEFAPVSDPYTVGSIDIRGHFRFKAVVIGDETRVEYIKIQTYYIDERQPVLLHLSRHASPVALAEPAPDALTGINHLYSPRLERELSYACALYEVAR